MTLGKLIFFIPVIFSLVACKSEQTFSGGVEQACGAESQTIINPLTPSIYNNSPNQVMRYQIGLQGCDNANLQQATIKTDFKAILSRQDPINYRLTSMNGTIISEGAFSVVRGSDLFGNTGEQYSYWESDPNTIPIESGFVLLELDFSHLALWPNDAGVAQIPQTLTSTTVETYFSLSNAGVVAFPLPVEAPLY